jgi:hypothetical protein
MRRHVSLLPGAVGLMLSLGGCRQFLDSTKLKENPNDPKVAPSSALFVAALANYYSQQEGQLARTTSIWMQQFSGQLSPFNNLGLYQYGVDDYLNNWSRAYGGGGLLDLRTIEQRALAVGDSTSAGEAIILEALQIGETADIWGDVPYAQAAQPSKYPQPAVQPQQVVYDSILHALASAITYLQASGTTNVGVILPGVVYQWTPIAYTIRARYFMHMAAKLGPAMYDSAAANAALGITDSTGASDFNSIQGQTATTANLWSDFQSIYIGTMAAGSTMIDIMNADNDPRLPLYWAVGDSGTYVGADPASGPPDPGELSQLSDARSAQAFGQPLVTYAENTLIRAEAACQRGDGTAALSFLQQEERAAGVPQTATVSLKAIMTEKYLALFQNIEIWNDWKRTGIPLMINQAQIPHRLTYPLSEREANKNIPADGALNWNDTGTPVTSNCG